MHSRLWIASLLLVAATAVSFAPLLDAGITNWDDGVYLQSASMPLGKLLTARVLGNFHPLTMLSFAAEVRLFGVRAAELHAMNILLHAGASLLVLLFLFELTGNELGALAGALFFAVHPLRVESVGWIAERKDVLCALLFAAALLAYVRHLRRGTHFGWVFVFFVLAVLAKATAVVFPIVVLLVAWRERRRPSAAQTGVMFATSVAFGVIAVLAQRGPGALAALPGFAFSLREKALLACRALVMYIAREIVPLNLSAFYPYPKAIGLPEILSGVAIVVLAGLLALFTQRWRAPAFGCAFFFVAVAPTLPLLSIGQTMAADRYTLLPSIGLAYLVALAAAQRKQVAVPAIIAVVLIVLTWRRCAVWHDSVSLWSSVIDYDDGVAMAYNNRAIAQAAANPGAAKRDLDRAIALDRCYGTALKNRALLAGRASDFTAADTDLQQAIRCDPSDTQARQMRASLQRYLAKVEP